MELHELGAEYLQRADILNKRIHELNTYVGKLSGDDRLKLKNRISLLYADAAECRRCAMLLINYRRKKDDGFEQE